MGVILYFKKDKDFKKAKLEIVQNVYSVGVDVDVFDPYFIRISLSKKDVDKLNLEGATIFDLNSTSSEIEDFANTLPLKAKIAFLAYMDVLKNELAIYNDGVVWDTPGFQPPDKPRSDDD